MSIKLTLRSRTRCAHINYEPCLNSLNFRALHAFTKYVSNMSVLWPPSCSYCTNAAHRKCQWVFCSSESAEQGGGKECREKCSQWRYKLSNLTFWKSIRAFIPLHSLFFILLLALSRIEPFDSEGRVGTVMKMPSIHCTSDCTGHRDLQHPIELVHLAIFSVFLASVPPIRFLEHCVATITPTYSQGILVGLLFRVPRLRWPRILC